MIQIAVLGYGVVGSGVVEVFYKNHDSFIKKTANDMDIKYILDIRDFNDHQYADKFTKDFEVIANDDSVKVVAELIGGIEPAYSFVKTCLQKGKNVVTSNKELVAAKGAELLALAKKHDVNFLFEASVGGGIPIIRPLHQCLAANEIYEIAGILNGTTNFILTKMFLKGMAFHDALALAQQLGYAERNPAADIEGHDSCRKICILSSLSFGEHIYPASVHTEGITAITAQDVQYAESFGSVIKLIGRAKKLENGKISVMVCPAFIALRSQLSGVDDVFNGILVRGDATGDVIFYGKGAGKLPTASAVVADIIDCVKAGGNIGSLNWVDSGRNMVEDYKLLEVSKYIRLLCADANPLELLSGLIGEVTPLIRAGSDPGEYACVTPVLQEQALDAALEKLKQQRVEVLSQIRILDC